MEIKGSQKQIDWIHDMVKELRESLPKLEEERKKAFEEGRRHEAQVIFITIKTVRLFLEAFDAAEEDTYPENPDARNFWFQLVSKKRPYSVPRSLEEAIRNGIDARAAIDVLLSLRRQVRRYVGGGTDRAADGSTSVEAKKGRSSRWGGRAGRTGWRRR